MRDIDYIEDLIHLDYDPKQVEPGQIVDVVGKEGLEATISPRGPPKGEGQ